MKKQLSILAVVLIYLNISAQDNANLAQSPPMGWNSWDCFGMDVTEDQIMEAADYMAENLSQFGWEYIILDMGWNFGDGLNTSNFRTDNPPQCIDNYGRLIPNMKKFPSSANGNGLRDLANYIHGKGLKFGIHIMRGIPRQAVERNLTIKGTQYKAKDIVTEADACNWYHGLFTVDMSKPGSQEYYNSLLEMYAEWGVDYIKADDMLNKYHIEEIEAISRAIKKSGRPIVLSLSAGPVSTDHVGHLRSNANLWRISGDMWDDWSYIIECVELCRQWQNYVVPNHWADCDILPLGKLRINGTDGLLAKRIGILPETTINEYSRFNDDEKLTLLTLWTIFRSPLIIGGKLKDLDKITLNLLTNKDVLSVSKNSTNNREISFRNNVSIWAADNNRNKIKYMAVINLNDTPCTIDLPIEYTWNKKVTDLWNIIEIAKSGNVYRISLPSHGSGLYSIK